MTSKANDIMNVDLYLVRHGETIANANDILQGHCDYPLTDKGINEGNCVGIALSNMNWDKVYCSDLGRASHTCKLLLSQSKTNPNIIVEENKLLRECNFGVREALKKETSVEEARIIVANKLGIAPEDVVDTAESHQQLKERQQLFINKLIEDLSSINDNNDTINILVVSHGGYLKYFIKEFWSITGSYSLLFLIFNYNYVIYLDMEKIKNCSISKVTMKIDKVDKSYSLECQRTDLNLVNHIKKLEHV